MRVLIAEDQAPLAGYIADGLRDEGIAADVAYDGSAALYKAGLSVYDVILLDRDLPEIHGDEVCAALKRAENPARILMLTAAAAVADRVEGLSLGADDYLPKPFAFAELVARIRTLARRAPSPPPVTTHGDLSVDHGRRRATRAGRELPLTRKELAVLEVLITAGGSVTSTEQLLERVWDENADPFTHTVTVTVARLRRKLGDPDPIETVTGAGYRMR